MQVISPRKTGIKRVRIAKRSKAHPVAAEDLIQSEANEWEDTASVGPKKAGSGKVRVRGKRWLKPVGLTDDSEE